MKVKDKCFPFGVPPEADTLLFCFHHAGGNAGQLRSWCGVKNDIAVVPVEYAGHGCRMGEKFSSGLCEIAEELAGKIAVACLGKKVYLYGHSLGSLIAFETVKCLEKWHVPVQGLVVAGRGAPFDRDYSSFRSCMGREALLEEMRRLGGMDDRILEDQGFMDYFAPIILSDYALFENYCYDKGCIHAPICAHCAMQDVETSPEQMSHWSMVTNGAFEETVFEGGHFFVLESEQYLETLLGTVRKMKRGVYYYDRKQGTDSGDCRRRA